jgi:Skp family chaperone for outer membrane proteins
VLFHRRLMAVATLAGGLSSLAVPVLAQQNKDWFVPGQGQGQQRSAPASRPAPHPAPRQMAPMMAPAMQPQMEQGGPSAGGDAGPPPIPTAQFQLPPEPALTPLAKGAPPPAPLIGVLGVPEIMRACAAAQTIEATIGVRRQKLNDDAQKEQSAWRDLQQQLVNQRSTLTPDQIRAKERELQERITNAQRQFRERNRVIQEAAQFALAQIERTLIQVIRQVAESRGMNLVLHRNQVALNVAEFDITEQVATQLNKVLPSVTIPADGQEPPTIPLASAAPPSSPLAVAPAAAPPAAPAPAPAAKPH